MLRKLGGFTGIVGVSIAEEASCCQEFSLVLIGWGMLTLKLMQNQRADMQEEEAVGSVGSVGCPAVITTGSP